MQMFSRKSRTRNRAARKVNQLRLEALEARMLLSISNPGVRSHAFQFEPDRGVHPAIGKDNLIVMPEALQQLAEQNNAAEGAGSIDPTETYHL